jgi:hypothetical protein
LRPRRGDVHVDRDPDLRPVGKDVPAAEIAEVDWGSYSHPHSLLCIGEKDRYSVNA